MDAKDIEPYDCPYCGKRLWMFKNLVRHVWDKHGIEWEWRSAWKSYQEARGKPHG